MRALVVHAYGEAPRLAQVRRPERAPGQALLQVRAAALNPVDLMIAAGRFYGPVPPPPYVAGAELVGDVVESDRLPTGSRAWALGATGGLGEYAAVPDDALVPLPDGIDNALAVACGVAGLAGWMSVRHRGELSPGETVVVLGASGVVGQVAVQAGAQGGAAGVVAVARSATGRERALALGATAALALDDPAGLAEALRAATEPGAHLVIDTLWGAPAAAALGALGRGGRLVQVGNQADPTAALPGGPLRGGRIDIRGFSVFSEEPADVARAYGEVAAAALAGELRISLERVDLDDAPAAWDRLARGAAGGAKLVVTP